MHDVVQSIASINLRVNVAFSLSRPQIKAAGNKHRLLSASRSVVAA